MFKIYHCRTSSLHVHDQNFQLTKSNSYRSLRIFMWWLRLPLMFWLLFFGSLFPLYEGSRLGGVAAISEAMIESVLNVMGRLNSSLNYKGLVASSLIAVNESISINSSETELVNAFSYVSSRVHDLRASNEASAHSSDVLQLLWNVSQRSLSELLEVELRSLWLLIQGAQDASMIFRFLDKAALVASVNVLAERKFAGEYSESDLDALKATVGYLGRDTVKSLPLSAFRRGSRVLHIGAGSGDLVRWLEGSGWFSGVHGVRTGAEWDGSVSEYEYFILSENKSMRGIFDGQQVEVLSRFSPGEGWTVNFEKSLMIQNYLRDENSAWWWYLT